MIDGNPWVNPPRQASRTGNRKLRLVQRLVHRDGARCDYCRTPLAPGPAPWPLNYIHVDHRRPKAKGGTDSFANLALACHHCNTRKADLEFDVWLMEGRCS